MPCTMVRFKGADGMECVAFVCSRGSRERRQGLPCVVCGRPHTRLCDGPPGAWPNIKSQSGTCSAPLCFEHAHPVGPDRDLCPRCMLKEQYRQERHEQEARGEGDW